MKKRLILILAFALIMTSFPLAAFGDDEVPAPEDPAASEVQTPQDGWNEDHSSYYANGAALADCVKKIDGRLYYFNGSGKVATFKGWKNVGGSRYWANASGTIACKPTRIKAKNGKKYMYMFGTGGKLMKKKGLFTYKGKSYFGASTGSGVIRTGWVASGKTAMYFYPKTGAMAKNTKIGYLKIPKSGKLGEAYALGIRTLNKNGWTLRSAYKFSYKLKYRNRWYRTKNSEKYAIRGFKKKNGNCYVMAATFYIQAKLLGYDVHQVKGKVGIWPHSWTIIRQNGRWYVYDPNFRNETGRNGFKIWYGKKGTWRYSKYHRMN